ncbi:MAG: agmatinase [Patescibacteria group bacterium]
MIKTIINSNTKDADAVIVSAGYERTVSSHKGTAAGPARVVEMLNTQIEFYDRKFRKNVKDFIQIAHEDLGDLSKFTPEQTRELIKAKCEKFVQAGKFIFLLGGEHTVSLGHLDALVEMHDPKSVTILDIDAHCDLRDDDSDYNDVSPSRLAHSTVMRRASELGYPIAQVGVRTYSQEEHEYFSNPKNNITVFEWGNKEKKEKTPVDEILKAIRTKDVYLSIDVDGFDPAHMPGTGTPVLGGIGWWYGIELLEKVVTSCNLLGADIVEVSPQEDTVLTEYGAAQLCYTILANKFRKLLTP